MLKNFQHRFLDTIWSIGYFGRPEAPLVWIETRGNEKSTWFSLDTKSADIVEIPMPTTKSLQWLAGLEDAGVFLQLRQGKNPGIERIECYNLPNGTLRYSFELSQWTQLIGEYLVTNQGTYNLNTGNKTINEPILRNELAIETPSHFEENQAEFQAFSTLFEQKFHEKIGKGMDYWEGSNKLIFSYYIYENAWKNRLRICDFEFNTLFLETLAEGDLMGYHTFQCVQNTLYFIKDKRELFIYADL
jgi:hypothetical protein